MPDCLRHFIRKVFYEILFNALFLILLTISVQAQNFPDSETDGKYYEVNGANSFFI